ncbi:MAG: alpha-N-arabinofuranosidase [Pseudolysinimonas sp.]|uniref:arabinosylfuranosidase ArfA n=1 Tax=Pseudolysinimonas sp. TaxID=2680009 RepID=UPI003265D336
MTTPAGHSRVSFDRDLVVAPLNRRVFGAFVEHLGRCVYDGLYEPGHPTADGDGFRRDVTDLVTELGVSTVRYPGGNFVSGYRWEDGVGPRESRPRRRDLAWHSLETNQIGIDEFARWSRLVDAEVMLAVNLGTRGVLEALDLLEYVNGAAGTTLADQRIANGGVEPYGIRMWCLGNEMDGPWQIGHMTALDYGKLAGRTASAMKTADPGLELVACGSSGSQMPTFGEWERVVLEQTYENVDYISAHAYYQILDGDLPTFLASALDMQYFIDTVTSNADQVKAALGSSKTMNISFDEWNIWYLKEHQEQEAALAAVDTDGTREWTVAPRLLEDVYTVADAVVLGSLLITLIRNADRVTSASLAQLVNVIAPIMTEPGGPAWRQTTFYPFALTSRLASGVVLAPRAETSSYATGRFDEVPLLDSVATYDEIARRFTVFAVNRSLDTTDEVEINLAGLAIGEVVEAWLIADDDPFAVNTMSEPDRVVPVAAITRVQDGALRVTLPPVSWAVVVVALGD